MISQKPNMNPDGTFKTSFNPSDFNINSSFSVSDIQKLLNKKADIVSPTFTGSLNAVGGSFSGSLVANGGLVVPVGKTLSMSGNISANGSTISPIALSYLDATSSIQTQINNISVGGVLQAYLYILSPASTVTLTQGSMARLMHIMLDKNTTFDLPISLPNGTRFSFYTYSIGSSFTLTLTSSGANRMRDVTNNGSPSSTISITSNSPLIELVVNNNLFWRIL